MVIVTSNFLYPVKANSKVGGKPLAGPVLAVQRVAGQKPFAKFGFADSGYWCMAAKWKSSARLRAQTKSRLLLGGGLEFVAELKWNTQLKSVMKTSPPISYLPIWGYIALIESYLKWSKFNASSRTVVGTSFCMTENDGRRTHAKPPLLKKSKQRYKLLYAVRYLYAFPPPRLFFPKGVVMHFRMERIKTIFWCAFVALPLFTGFLQKDWLPEQYDERRHDLIESHSIACGTEGMLSCEVADVWEDRKTGKVYRAADLKDHNRAESFRLACWRRLNFDHLCRLNLDQGLLLV